MTVLIVTWMYEELFSFVPIALSKGSFLLRNNKLWHLNRIKSSELKTVSLSRIPRDNLVNNDDATMYNNSENRDIS